MKLLYGRYQNHESDPSMLKIILVFGLVHKWGP